MVKKIKFKIENNLDNTSENHIYEFLVKGKLKLKLRVTEKGFSLFGEKNWVIDASVLSETNKIGINLSSDKKFDRFELNEAKSKIFENELMIKKNGNK